MYNYIRALGRRYGQNERWKSVDMNTLPLTTVFQEYKEVWVWVGHNLIPHEQAFDLTTLRQELHHENQPFPQWLTTIGNRALPVTDTPPTFETRTVSYADLWAAGYKVTPVTTSGRLGSDNPRGEEKDLIITRPDTDYDLFIDHCLVSINGLIHRLDYDPDGVRVVGGGEANLISNRNHIAAMSFLGVGKVSTITVTPDMITRSESTQPLSTVATIDTGVDLSGKTVGMVIGGYLHLLDNCCSVTGDTSISVQLQNLPLLQRWYSSKLLINVDSVPLTQSVGNKDQIAVSELLGDDFVKGYLTLSQSFVVIIDGNDLYVERTPLQYTGLPGRYIAREDLKYPLIGPLGNLLSYTQREQGGQYVIAVQDALTTYYQFEQTHWLKNHSVDNSRITYWMKDYSQCLFWEIGKVL